MADFLRRPRDKGGQYASTQTGNFDLYLPFIEKGIALLNDDGHLGFIAPSLWTMNEYGSGLRNRVMSGQHLWGWIDFGAYQVFDEATTYTALQFFSSAPNDAIDTGMARDGVVPEEPWSDGDGRLTYDRVGFGRRWLLTAGADRQVIDHLAEHCYRLDDPRVTRNIFVGIQTSADAIFHLQRIGPERYECVPRGRNAPPSYEVQIEDRLMKPLVSGADAKRYVEPRTDTYLLFPYRIDTNGARLIPADELAKEFPNAWHYLSTWESELRQRERGKMDHDDQWWAYNYPKNLEKQELEKLIVPRLVANVSCSVDTFGACYLDNVDVGGVTPASGIPSFFLAGVLNGPVANFVFRRISKPFRGNYRSANKQFIAPLPVPAATDEQRVVISCFAEQLQQLHTRRRDILEDIGRRRSVLRERRRPESWLFPDLPGLKELEAQAPSMLDSEQREDWVRRRFSESLAERHERLGARLSPGVNLAVELSGGELRFLVDDAVVVDRIFLDEEEAPFVAAQWKVLAASLSVTASTDGARLSSALRRLAVATDNHAAVRQIMEFGSDLDRVDLQIGDTEAELNEILYGLYGLDSEHIRRVEEG